MTVMKAAAGGASRGPRSSQDSGDRFENRSYGRGWDRDDDDDRDRGFFERAGDEVASWFGDEEAERRRREDADAQAAGARGRQLAPPGRLHERRRFRPL